MTRRLILLTMMTSALCSCGQRDKSTSDAQIITLDSISVKSNSKNKGFQTKNGEAQYDEPGSRGILIQNSLPKGGNYIDPTGKNFGYRVFWTRVVNENDTPIELILRFTADSLAIPGVPDSYLKLFLPPGTMTPDKDSEYDYGATSLKSFLDAGLNKSTMLQRTVKPKEESLFYVGALLYKVDGVPRAGLVLKGNQLFYKISIVPQLDSALIPCGRIAFNKLGW